MTLRTKWRWEFSWYIVFDSKTVTGTPCKNQFNRYTMRDLYFTLIYFSLNSNAITSPVATELRRAPTYVSPDDERESERCINICAPQQELRLIWTWTLNRYVHAVLHHCLLLPPLLLPKPSSLRYTIDYFIIYDRAWAEAILIEHELLTENDRLLLLLRTDGKHISRWGETMIYQ